MNLAPGSLSCKIVQNPEVELLEEDLKKKGAIMDEMIAWLKDEPPFRRRLE